MAGLQGEHGCDLCGTVPIVSAMSSSSGRLSKVPNGAEVEGRSQYQDYMVGRRENKWV